MVTTWKVKKWLRGKTNAIFSQALLMFTLLNKAKHLPQKVIKVSIRNWDVHC